jgi:hypothetical protein
MALAVREQPSLVCQVIHGHGHAFLRHVVTKHESCRLVDDNDIAS